jgi:O-antigen ligase
MVFTRRNLDWWCERGILLLVLATLVFAPVAFGAVYVWTFLVVQMLLTGVAALWLVRLWGGHKPKLLWPPLAWAVAAFVLYAAVRYATADIEYVARQEVIQVLMYAFLFLAVVCNLYNQETTEMIVYTLTAVAALTSSYALAQSFHHTNQVWSLTSPYPGRASGTYVNPDHFAGFLELVLPLPLAFLMAGRVSVITRVLLAYATLAILGGMAVTFSRGGWVAAAAGMVMLLGFLLCHRNHALRALLALVLLLGVGGFFTEHYLSTSPGFMRRVLRPDENGPGVLDTDSRLQMWQAAVHMWEDHPWWGVGPGHFDYRFREYRPDGFQNRPEHAHNDYLELLADWGVAGGLIVLGGVVIFIVGLVRTWPHVRREENTFGTGMSSRYAFFLGALSGLFALGVHSLVDFNLHIPANALAGVTILGLLASNVRFATKRYWWRARLPAQCALTAMLGALLVYLPVQAWRRGGEELWTKRAEAVKMGPDYSTEQAALLKKALACEPKNYLTAYNIGECYRTESFDGGDDYANLAQMALTYYELGMRLDPHDELCPLRAGMCLDWLGRNAEAEKYYAEAEERDPNGNFVVANIGWHYEQVGDYAAARQWFILAIKLSGNANKMAKDNLFEICQPKLLQKASGQLPMRLFYDGKDN